MIERVMIIGCSGSGKTTLAKQLAERTGLPLIHLDREYWRPGWIEPDKAEWTARMEKLIAQPRWIMDGNYGSTLAARMAAADAVIFLDFPRLLCMRRVLARSIAGYGRATQAEGCPERLDWEFLKYVWNWQRDSRPRVMKAIENFRGPIERLRAPAEIDGLFANLGKDRR